MGGEGQVSFMYLRFPLAGAERFSRVSHGALNRHCERVRGSEHASRARCRLLERRHCLAEIVERGGGVAEERHRIKVPSCRPRMPRRPPRRPPCMFCLHYTVLRCRRGVFVYKSACGRGASGRAGKSSHNRTVVLVDVPFQRELHADPSLARVAPEMVARDLAA